MAGNRFSALMAAFLLCVASPAVAEGPAPFPDFSAKRVKPPSKSTKKRITVQIAPQPNLPQVQNTAAQSPLRPASPATRYDWFWETVSPALADTGPGRLEPALNRIGKPPAGTGVAAPRLQTLQNITEQYGIDILKATVGTKVSPAFALAVIAVESGGRADAQSGAGAQGLMQLMPGTATRFGVSDSFDAAQNIKGGVAFLDFLMDKFAHDPILVLAGYNAGENSIAAHNGVPPFAETRDYVPKVLAAFSVSRGLCLTPPQLVTDGCVFRRMTN